MTIKTNNRRLLATARSLRTAARRFRTAARDHSATARNRQPTARDFHPAAPASPPIGRRTLPTVRSCLPTGQSPADRKRSLGGIGEEFGSAVFLDTTGGLHPTTIPSDRLRTTPHLSRCVRSWERGRNDFPMYPSFSPSPPRHWYLYVSLCAARSLSGSAMPDLGRARPLPQRSGGD